MYQSYHGKMHCTNQRLGEFIIDQIKGWENLKFTKIILFFRKLEKQRLTSFLVDFRFLNLDS